MRFVGMAALAAVLVAAVNAAQAREVVAFRDSSVAAGTVIVRQHERRLYFVLGDGRAIRYPVGVGRAGKQWAGTTQIDGKYRNPAWSPPSEVRRDKPYMPAVIPGGWTSRSTRSSRNPSPTTASRPSTSAAGSARWSA